MSFILDALKKAEAERQRQTGPTLLEVRVTPPRRRFPLWTLVIGALLGINILLLIAFALRRPAISNAPPSVPAAAAPASSPVPAPNAPAAILAPPPATAAAAAPLAAPVAPALPIAPAAAASDQGAQNPADFEPAVPANSATADLKRQVNPGNHYEPPSLSELSGDMPDLRLDLHVYAARPADRYALINMHRVHEGDVLPEGPRVLAIDRDGVELSYRGTEFMLHPQ